MPGRSFAAENRSRPPVRLLVIVHDSLPALVRKGELSDRYYNPGELFTEVHLLALGGGGSVPAEQLSHTVGRAKLVLHECPLPSKVRTFGRHPATLRPWIARGIRLAKAIGPALVRCYGDGCNAWLAYNIQRSLGIPYIVSLHTMPDVNPAPWRIKWASWLRDKLIEPWRRRWLRHATEVLLVYEGIRPFTRRLGIERTRVCYNVLSAGIPEKTDYGVSGPMKILCVGRHTWGKNPAPIIRAGLQTPGVTLTVVGDGPLHGELERMVEAAGAADRVTFVPSLPNEELCRRLPKYDVFAAYSEYMEIPKAVLEPLIAGLPVVVNRRRGDEVPEHRGDHVLLVEGTSDGYAAAFNVLRASEASRRALGERAKARAARDWNPKATEAEFLAAHRRAVYAQ